MRLDGSWFGNQKKKIIKEKRWFVSGDISLLFYPFYVYYHTTINFQVLYYNT